MELKPSIWKGRGDYIGGEFRFATDPQGEWVVRSPAELKDELAKITYSYGHVDLAVDAARNAFSSWRKVPLENRCALLRQYQSVLKRRAEEGAELIARETGKPLWESKTEVSSMINKIDITLTDSLEAVRDRRIENILPGTTGVWTHRPLGVCAVIGPFNFPGHLPNGHIVPALMTGNTVVFKPSEKAPLVGQWMAECFQEAGFPAGVFNLLQGEKEVGRRLCIHEGVAAVLFTGSYEVGTRIKQDTLLQHWKLLALEMGGKNAAIVCADTDLEYAVHEALVGAFLSCGQRCSATSRVLVAHELYDQFVERFHERAKSFKIGHPLEPVFMGPLIDASSVDRCLKFANIASRDGYEVVMRGKSIEPGHKGYYVTPTVAVRRDFSADQARKSVFFQSELFAPFISITGFGSVAEAIDLANNSQFGLVASVFTPDRAVFEKCVEDLEVGLVNWNRATVGASSRLPFGGLKKSGNFFPTAVTATNYCTHPMGLLEVEKPGTPTSYIGLD